MSVSICNSLGLCNSPILTLHPGEAPLSSSQQGKQNSKIQIQKNTCRKKRQKTQTSCQLEEILKLQQRKRGLQSPVSHNITIMQVRCSDDNDKSETTATPDAYSTEEMRQCHSKDRETQSRINKGQIEAVRRGSMMVNNEIKGLSCIHHIQKHMHTHEHTNICVHIQNDCCGSW